MSFLDQSLFRCVAVAIMSAAIAGAFGCKEKENAGSAPPSPAAPQVEVVTVMARTVPDEPEFIGEAEASRPVEIRSQVTGILKAVLFPEGRAIKKGTKLYQIDPVPFEAAYKSAQARIAEAEARLVQAKQDLARVKPLLEAQAVSQKDVDDAIAEDLAAKASLQRAQADLIKAKFDFDNTRIIAPIDGLIERSRYYEGRLVSAQTDLLTVIHRIDPMYVVVNVPESFLLKRRQDAIAVGLQHPGLAQLKGTVIFADGSTYNHEGVLDFADVGLRTETGARRARFVLPNPDGVLLPGQFVRVRFKGTMKDHALLVPQRAVQQGPQGPIVFVVGDEDKVEIRPIKASRWHDQEWIIESGVRSGERVIVSGFHMVRPGAPVKPVPAAEPAAEPTGNGKPDNSASNGGADHEAEPKSEATREPQ